MEGYAILFPGQGSQYAGMGRHLVQRSEETRNTFEEASDILGRDIAALCCTGTEEELRKAENTQLSILVASVASYRFLVRQLGSGPACALGHSIGEYAALVAAEVLTFADALRLVRTRSLLMATAATPEKTGMLAIIGATNDVIEALCKARSEPNRIVEISAYNSDNQIVLSGHIDALRDIEMENTKPTFKAVPLKVGGPFHCSLMTHAADSFKKELDCVEFRKPMFPLISNVTARSYQDVNDFASHLADHLRLPVRWSESVRLIHDQGVGLVIDAGPGVTLKRLATPPFAQSLSLSADDAADLNLATEKIFRPKNQRFTDVVLDLLGTLVATRNALDDPIRYRELVVAPYRTLEALGLRAQEPEGIGNQDVRQALHLADEVLAAKGVGCKERTWRIRRILVRYALADEFDTPAGK